MKKLITLVLLALLCLGLLLYNFSLRPIQPPTPTEPEPEQTTTPTGPSIPAAGQVRILNTDPQRQEAWEALAEAYTAQTGTDVQILTAADDAQPTLFTVSGPEELAQVKGQCLDLSATEAYAQLASWDLALAEDGKVCAIAAEIEAFGLIYNSSLLGYVATQSEITGLASLTTVAQTITADSEMDFAAFACPDLEGEFAARLASVGADCRAFWDLYSANAACAPETLAETRGANSLKELLEGKAVFYLGSTDDYDRVADLGDHKLGILPLYLGGENELRQGLCVAATGYWCVRSDAPEQDIEETLAFLDYLVKPGKDGTVPVDDLQLMAPYRQATYAANPLERTLRSDLAAGKEYVVCPKRSAVPAGLADALAAYAADPTDDHWAAVTALLSN